MTASPAVRILLLCHSFNSLSQRLFVALQEEGHAVSVELDISDSVTEEAVALFKPDLLVAPFLKRRIPEAVWRRQPCLIVHPGPPGDQGSERAGLGAARWGAALGRHGAAGHGRLRRRPGLGERGICHAGGAQRQPLPP